MAYKPNITRFRIDVLALLVVLGRPQETPNFDTEIQKVRAIQAQAGQACQQKGGEFKGADCILPVPEPPKEVKIVSTPPKIAQEGDAKLYIYMKESGNNPAAVNSLGCRGLGQACPGSKLPCGNDYACQDAWFTNYMQGRYGTWENARAFHMANGWW